MTEHVCQHVCPYCGGPATPIPPGFGARLRAARGFAGISQQELAQRIAEMFAGEASASAPTIKRIEGGATNISASAETWAFWVAKATGVPVDFMLNGFAEGEASNG